jgi:hypothetical protein
MLSERQEPGMKLLKGNRHRGDIQEILQTLKLIGISRIELDLKTQTGIIDQFVVR